MTEGNASRVRQRMVSMTEAWCKLWRWDRTGTRFAFGILVCATLDGDCELCRRGGDECFDGLR